MRPLLSIPAVTALGAAGLVPVGQVMGCIVMHLSRAGMDSGGYRNSGNRLLTTPVRSSARSGSSYIRGRYHAYERALARLVAEAKALHADGVVGVTLTWSQLDSGASELVALGTAVRDRDPRRRRPGRARPYCTELSGEDTAAAVLSGWKPLGIVVGLSLAAKREDATMRWQTSRLRGPGNVEVTGMTRLVQVARSDARDELLSRAAKFDGAAQVVISRSDLWVGHKPGQNGEDVVAEASFIGTVLAHDPDGPAREPVSRLSILPLRDTARSSDGGPAAVRSTATRGEGRTDG